MHVPLLKNNRLGCKCLTFSNTLAYCAKACIKTLDNCMSQMTNNAIQILATRGLYRKTYYGCNLRFP
jgi:hypothetical protein